MDFLALGAGAVSIDDVVLSQSGQALAEAIQAAPVENLTGFDTRAGIISFSRAAFQVREGGAALEAVTLNREHGTRGELTALVSLSDGAAATSSGDYTSGVIQVRFADGEISQVVDLANQIAVDGQLEGNETIHLSVVLAAGAPAGAAVGLQSTATLTVVDADSAGTFAFSAAEFEVRENGSEPNTVTSAHRRHVGRSHSRADSDGHHWRSDGGNGLCGVADFPDPGRGATRSSLDSLAG